MNLEGMVLDWQYLKNKASTEQIYHHLKYCDDEFYPPLSSRMNLKDYAKKISTYAIRFEAWSNETLIGLVAIYCNDHDSNIGYITNVSLYPKWRGNGIASYLLTESIQHTKDLSMESINLQVSLKNKNAIRLYTKHGFIKDKNINNNMYLIL